MNEEIKALRERAEHGKFLYGIGAIDREECREMVMPYIEAFNVKSKEIAKKYGMRAKTITFSQFLR